MNHRSADAEIFKKGTFYLKMGYLWNSLTIKLNNNHRLELPVDLYTILMDFPLSVNSRCNNIATGIPRNAFETPIAARPCLWYNESIRRGIFGPGKNISPTLGIVISTGRKNSALHRRKTNNRKEEISMNHMEYIERLEQFISASVSPCHCILKAAETLSSAGFTELPLSGSWKLEKGCSYYVRVFDSTLIGFSIGKETGGAPALRLAASHTDWPCLKVKPSPEVSSGRYGKLNVEVYGGPLLGTWFDRPLSMAGKVCTAGENPMEPKTIFVDFKRPVLTIPNLAIHMNRQANEGVALNPQIDMLPILTLIKDELEKDTFFIDALAAEAGVTRDEILDYEIYIYNAESGTAIGLKDEFYSSPRLDNLTSVQACLRGLINSRCNDRIHVIALYDNEEIGSKTKQGAASSLMDRVLEKIFLSLGYSRETFLNSLFDGFLLSLDVAHAIHPNHGEKCDIKNQILMGDGVAIKLAASQAYATDASSTGVIEAICRSNQIPYKKFSNRSDIKGGSTLGSISSSFLTMRTVDVGIPMLAMHSAREVMGAADQKALEDLVTAYFNA